MKKITSVILLLCAFNLITDSAYADDVFKNDPVVVTASRYETSVSKEGKDISVITEDDIRKSGKKTVADVLTSVAGVTITRSGSEGSLSNVYIRGSKSGNVLLMIDGVKLSDPTTLGNLYDISGLTTSNIERIEIIKGAMSSLYGAEASGGVINIITKKGSGRKLVITGEAGSYRTHSESVSASDSTDKSSFFFSGSHYKTDGISNAKKSFSAADADNDGYENYTASCKVNSNITDKASVNMTMNYSDSKSEIDDDAFEDDPNHIYTNRLFTARGEFKHSPLDWWSYKGGLSYMSFVREDIDQKDSVDTTESNVYTYDGSSTKADIMTVIDILNFNAVTLGAEVIDEKGGSTSSYSASPSISPEKSILTKSLYLHDKISVFDILILNAGGRIDNHETFGSHWTWDASAALLISVTGTKLKTSAGTGFRAPSLFELYGQYGNEDVKPEKSFVYDAGVYQELFNGILSADCTFFSQEYEDLITWHSTGLFTGYYDNSDGTVRYKGAELTAGFRPSSIFRMSYAYTYIKYDNKNSNVSLKRPAHKHSASVTLTPVTSLDLTFTYLYVGKRYDLYFAPPTYAETRVKLDSYQKVDMNIRYAFNETVTFTARGENLTDANYMETYGYNTKGRSFYGGAEITL